MALSLQVDFVLVNKGAYDIHINIGAQVQVMVEQVPLFVVLYIFYDRSLLLKNLKFVMLIFVDTSLNFYEQITLKCVYHFKN